jgi:aromatic ring-opening dioxygenase catalytic subunit (LigB family)
MTDVRQPAIFLPHGGGPCFWMKPRPPFAPNAWDSLRDYLAGVVAGLPERPRAFVVVTAHWEEARPTVSVAAAPGMLFDYYGFPAHTYELSYPAPGEPEVAAEAKRLLEAAGLSVGEDATRGFDHGVFVPMLIVDPKAEIPVVMVSIERDLDAKRHIAIGKALAPLRDQGVVVVGSGMSYHDLKAFFDGDGRAAAAFDAWLDEAATKVDPEMREARLIRWAEAPAARACHPREEHLIPLMVAAGAGGTDAGTRSFHDTIGGKAISGFRFG